MGLPKIRVQRYPLHNSKDAEKPGWAPILGIEFTGRANEFTWRPGPGIAIGLGLIDIWFGWPTRERKLHYKGCLHDKSVQPA